MFLYKSFNFHRYPVQLGHVNLNLLFNPLGAMCASEFTGFFFQPLRNLMYDTSYCFSSPLNYQSQPLTFLHKIQIHYREIKIIYFYLVRSYY